MAKPKSPLKPRRSQSFTVYTPERYGKLVSAFSVVGANMSAAAKMAGVSREAAHRAYNYGWYGVPWAKPIYQVLGLGNTIPEVMSVEDKQKGLGRQVLISALREALGEEPIAEEDVESVGAKMRETTQQANKLMREAEFILADAEAKRQALIEEQQRVAKQIDERLSSVDAHVNERLAAVETTAAELHKKRMAEAEDEAKRRFTSLLDKAKVDAAEVMADEAAATKFGRKSAVGAAALAAIVLQDAQAVAAQVREAMKHLKAEKPGQAIKLVKDLVVLAKEAQKVVIYALQAERLRVGKPTEIVGMEFTEISLEEQEIQVEALRMALEERKEIEARQKRLEAENAEATGEGVARRSTTLN